MCAEYRYVLVLGLMEKERKKYMRIRAELWNPGLKTSFTCTDGILL